MIDQGTPLTLGRSFWAIDPLALPRLIEARAHQAALSVMASRIEAPLVANHKPSDRPGGAVAVIPLAGVLTPRASMLSLLFGGGGGLQEFRANFQAAVANPDISSIVLDVDSPGGLVSLIPETAAEVASARGVKPITAVVNTMAASAAYWIASQADEIVSSPTGTAGSIGVYMVHEDYSGMNEKAGVQTTYISAGKYKVEGNPDQPMSDEGKAEWQAEADQLYGMFVEAVAEGRQTTPEAIRSGYGQGRTAIGTRAQEMGLVDRVDTLEGVVRGQLEGKGHATAAVPADVIQAEHVPFHNTLCDVEHGQCYLIGDVTHSCSKKNDLGRLCLLEAGHEDDCAFRVGDDPETVEEPEAQKPDPMRFAFAFID